MYKLKSDNTIENSLYKYERKEAWIVCYNLHDVHSEWAFTMRECYLADKVKYGAEMLGANCESDKIMFFESSSLAVRFLIKTLEDLIVSKKLDIMTIESKDSAWVTSVEAIQGIKQLKEEINHLYSRLKGIDSTAVSFIRSL